MKYTEEKYLNEVKLIYPNYKIVSKFKGLTQPILIEDEYGILSIKQARLLLLNKPSILQALNKTEYFMSQLRKKQPELAKELTPVSEYVAAKQKMLFRDRYGIVSVNPDNLIHGHKPTIRAAINRKEYFKNQLLFLYDNKYDFIITSTDRHKGKVQLICPIHGSQYVDSDGIFLGKGCPACNKNTTISNTFYFIELYNENESFYKIGISYIYKDKIRRFNDYNKMGYNVRVIYTYEFNDALQCKEFEFRLKKIINPFLYTPLNWPNKTSTECFSKDICSNVLKIIEYDIVSTSMETQSSLISGHELTTHVEDQEI